MKKEQKSNISLERYYSAITHFIISSEEGILTRKEIENHMVRDKICHGRQVSKILKYLTDKEYLVQEKMLGTKRRGYTINEEIIGKKNESFVTIGLKKNGMPIYDRMTQTELNQEFKDMIKRYRKMMGKKKSDLRSDDLLFYILHVTFITISLSWISRLILSVQGGVFHNKTGKITIANNNAQLLEKFLGTLCYNFQKRLPNQYDLALGGMLHFFESLDPFVNTKYSRTTTVASSLLH
ncbi:MAG: hypothetical protein IIA83_04700 [Thaumarchaeota archaeon]|nr:hypothetical protein [Nitrososphaerota archaeon]